MNIGTVRTKGYTAEYPTNKKDIALANSSFVSAMVKSNSLSTKTSVVEEYNKKHPNKRTHVNGQVRSGKEVLKKNRAEDVSRENMTMEEYKEFFTSLMNSIPSDPSHQRDIEVWNISEKGWEQMKNDPEYEAWVLGYTAQNRAVHNPFAAWGCAPCYVTEQFGASIEEHAGQTMPMNDSDRNSLTSSDEESWWKKRHKNAEELLEEQEKAMAKRKHQQEQWMQRQMVSNSRMQRYFTGRITDGRI